MIPTPSGLRPSPPDRGSRPHRTNPARAEPLPYGIAATNPMGPPQKPSDSGGRPMWRPAVGRDDPAHHKSPLIRPCGPPSPLGGEGFGGAFYRLPPLRGEAVERSETDEGANDRALGGIKIPRQGQSPCPTVKHRKNAGRSNLVVFLSPYRASRVPCLSGFGCFVPRTV